ncbi:MAG: glycosyltransferase family 9 protein [Candidatus Omnitrophota bacterium]|nr:glycosyltransferase family 9 protein [Candidatus Omnitrophota bacterium]
MIKSILVIRNDRFGEFLLNIPAMRALKERYPQAKLTLAVDSAVYELAGAVECVDAVVVWDEVKGNLRKHKFDLGVVLNPTKEAHWAVFWAGIPARVGYNRKWGFLLTHKLKDTKHQGTRHEVDCNLELVSLIASGTSCPRNDGGLRLPRNDKYEFLAGAIAIHPFTSDLVKQWPTERFGELAQKIMEYRGQSPAGTVPSKVKVVFVGRTENRGQSPAGTVPSSDGIINMISKTSLVELAALLKRCHLLISCDSGPMHLAAAVGTPVIALFRKDLPGKTAQRWGPWGEGHVVIERSSLNDITVDEVFEKVKKGLLCPPLADSQ